MVRFSSVGVAVAVIVATLLIVSSSLFAESPDFDYSNSKIPAKERADKQPKLFEKCLPERFKDVAELKKFFEDRRALPGRANLEKLQVALATAKKDLLAAVTVSDGLQKELLDPKLTDATLKSAKRKEWDKAKKVAQSKQEALNNARYTLFAQQRDGSDSPLDLYGDIWSEPLKAVTLNEHPDNPQPGDEKEIWYPADGTFYITGDRETLTKKYNLIVQTLTNLGNYQRKPKTLKGFEHVFAFQRVEAPDKDGMAKPIIGQDDVSNEKGFFSFISAGSKFGVLISYWYYVVNHLMVTPNEFSLKFWSAKSFLAGPGRNETPKLENTNALTVYNYYDTVGNRVYYPYLGVPHLPKAFGGWCAVIDDSVNPPVLYGREQTGGQIKLLIDFSIGATEARATIAETIYELISGSVM
jgi:hypothetical protein